MPKQESAPASDAEFTKSLERLKEASRDLKDRIEEEKHKQDMPLDSRLGNPEWEQQAKDGRFDKPADEEE